jgi:hypothetical protein
MEMGKMGIGQTWKIKYPASMVMAFLRFSNFVYFF